MRSGWELARYGIPRTLQNLVEHHLVHYMRTLGARSDGFEYLQGELLHSQVDDGR